MGIWSQVTGNAVKHTAVALLRNPRHLLVPANIFLLSHMRARTSLLGHILGSHLEIEGYYEMHISYRSWRSLWKQKLLYFAEHQVKPKSRYMFDKLLHSYYSVSPEILTSKRTKIILMLRSPECSIRSIVAMYRSLQPEHEQAKSAKAADYYVKRLNSLRAIGERMEGSFLYLDSDMLTQNSGYTLETMSDWLCLSRPLSADYELFPKTGTRLAGDSSANIRTGKIRRKECYYSEVRMSNDCLDLAWNAYSLTRRRLLETCDTAIALTA